MNISMAPTAFKIMSLKQNVDGVPYVFMPDLGGNVLYCRDLVARLSDGISPCALPLTDQVLGRLETITIEELAEIFAAMLCERFPEGEIHLAGFSFAGILAFETARALEKSNRPVSHVWLFDTRAHRLHMPSVVRQAPLRELKSFVSYFTKRLVERNLNDDGTVLHSYRLLTLDLNERPKAYWPIIRSMHRALSSYRPKPVLDMPLTLFRAKEAAGQPIRPDFLGWDRLTRGSATVISVEADHMSIMHADSSLNSIAARLNDHCNKE